MIEISKNIYEYKKIYIYGAGYYGRLCHIFLAELGVDVAGFIQSTLSDYPEILGLKIIELEKFENTNEDFQIIVAVSAKYRDQITEELKKRCFKYLSLSDEDFIEMESRCLFNLDLPIKKLVNVLLYHRINIIQSKTRALSYKK